MRVFITGDVHGDKQQILSIPDKCPIGNGDLLLVCGDFGIPWSVDNIKRWREERDLLKWFDEQPFITAFIDGNHENFDLLNRFPTAMKWGGQVHCVSDRVFHLMRGEIFDFKGDGTKTFTFGGATSVDKIYRTEHISWWKEENASQSEKNHGIDLLKSVNWNVDYVITHTAPEQFLSVYQHVAFNKLLLNCPTQSYLTEIHRQLAYQKWYFGHFHDDVDSSYYKCRLLFDDIVEIGK